MTAGERRVITVPGGKAGMRVDRYLTEAVPECSRARLQQWLRDGHITIAGKSSKASAVLRGGESIAITPPTLQPSTVVAEAIPLAVLYEDADIIVINKPAGMAVHPGAGRSSGTLVNALLAHVRDLSGIGGIERPGIVHRLDKDTTGVLIVAKHDRAHQELARQFHDREVDKCYVAMCYGALRGDGEINLPIGRHPTERTMMSARSRRGRTALTQWRVREAFGNELTLLEIRIATGRTHQIRVHLSAIGHPLVGDPVYGGRRTIKRLPPTWHAVVGDFQRPALHAWRLRVQHPISGAPCEWTAPIPADVEALIVNVRDVIAQELK